MSDIVNNTVKKVFNALNTNGFKAYLVGGCVRDFLLSTPLADYDITTNATPDEIKKACKAYKTIDTGIKHGTVTVIADHLHFEITTMRTDGKYTDNRHPGQVKFIADIKDDLARRDFTINAMAMTEDHEILDFYNGKKDLNDKLIRCVGNADMRFKEDALRILRAIRFSSTLGFRIEDETKAAIFKNKNLLNNISLERIRQELEKLLLGINVTNVLIDFKEVIGVIIPEFKSTFSFAQNTPHHCYDIYTHIVKSVEYVPQNKNLRLTMLFHDIGKPSCYMQDKKGGHFKGHPAVSKQLAEKIMTRLRFDRKTISFVTQAVLQHDNRFPATEIAVKKFISKFGNDFFYDYILIRTADTMAQSDYLKKEKLIDIDNIKHIGEKLINEEACPTLKDLAISGKDLIDAGIKEGAPIGETLNYLLNAVLEGKIANQKSSLLEETKKCIKEKKVLNNN